MWNRVLADDGHRCGVAAADAGRVKNPHAGPQEPRKPRQQGLRAGQIAGNRVADADRDGRRRRVALFNDVEVMIESGDLAIFISAASATRCGADRDP
jgi:hypothetical protein